MKTLLCVGALGVLASFASAQTRIQILHASDLEGGVDAIGDAPNFAAVVQALENDATGKSVPSMVLSSGDNYIPGPFFSAAGDRSLRTPLRTVLANPAAREGDGRVDLAIMNVVGFDAAAVGNHEFDNGPNTFGGLIGTDIRNGNEPRWLGAQFPYLSANLDFSGESSLSRLFTGQLRPSTDFESPIDDLQKAASAPKLAAAAIVVRGGERYGIVGATTPLVQSISSTGGVVVKSPGAGSNDMALLAQVLQPTIDSVLQAGVNKVILVSHLQQFALEQALIQRLRGVDIVIAGGSDRLLADSSDRLRAGDTAQGPYPTVTTNADNDPALLVSTDGQYSYVGRLVVSFDARGVVIPTSVTAAESGAFVTDDQGVIDTFGSLSAAFAPGTKGARVRTLTNAVSGVVRTRDGNIVGKASVFLEGRRTPVRTEETNFGALTAQANLAVAQDFDGTVLVSAKNGGGIRNPIGSIDGSTGALGPNKANPLSGKQAGEVSQLDIENTLRFNNGLTLITLTRAQLKGSPRTRGGGVGQRRNAGSVRPVRRHLVQLRPDAGSRFTGSLRLADQAWGSRADRGAGRRRRGSNPVRIVTLDFLANGGDSYPYPGYVQQNPQFANVVQLRQQNLPDGRSTFAPAGSEQDALAEFFLANFAQAPYAIDDSAVEDDQRVQQVGTRPGLRVQPDRFQQRFTLTDAQARSVFVVAVGLQGAVTRLDLGALGDLEYGIRSVLLLPAGVTSRDGDAQFRLPRVRLPVRFAAQVLVVDSVGRNGIDVSTSESVAFGGR